MLPLLWTRNSFIGQFKVSQRLSALLDHVEEFKSLCPKSCIRRLHCQAYFDAHRKRKKIEVLGGVSSKNGPRADQSMIIKTFKTQTSYKSRWEMV